MFIHLGENVIIHSKDVVAILDRDSVVDEFFEKQAGQIVELTKTEYKSVVVTINQIYFSPLSSNTLKKRAQLPLDIDSTLEEDVI
ncbi:extracellular matrix regulator RemB [Litchfieldia alkalitelluris]|uniref:extracellular matrix regulator RemB n=1 Tax=Litchfieldia alkalitelluris TaxID=304268 RepID=UPI000996DD48|nr:extracellular matrix/biofilm biosynthesis regulator RemA family protein [Litchfieldia alkalitelluris]